MEKVRTLTTPDQCKAAIQAVLTKFNNLLKKKLNKFFYLFSKTK